MAIQTLTIVGEVDLGGDEPQGRGSEPGAAWGEWESLLQPRPQ